MIKHASSHGLSVLVCTVAGSFLVKAIEPVWPWFLGKMHGVSEKLINLLTIPMNKEALTTILIPTGLAAIWGIVFKMSRRRNI